MPNFLGVPEVAAEQVLPQKLSVEDFNKRMLELASPRLGFMAERLTGIDGGHNKQPRLLETYYGYQFCAATWADSHVRLHNRLYAL